MKMKVFLLLAALFFTACSLDINLLSGRWKAVGLFENGQSLPAPLDSVALTFSSDMQYEFRTIGFYREAGPFRIADTHLFLSDTTERPPKEHVLKVLFLSDDTLKIQMVKGGKEQVLFLKKAD